MCGIFGYVGEKNAVDLAIEGLKRLEYRGYDSAGIAGTQGGKLIHCKEVGKVAVLEQSAREQHIDLDTAIAHTRWATHGLPTHHNAHPHFDVEQSLAVVHNGIIENYRGIRQHLHDQGVSFVSETDSEVVAQLMGTHYQGDLLEAVQKTIPELSGAFAIALLHKEHPDEIVVAVRESPLAIGLGEHENFVASDVNAFLAHTRKVIYLEEGELARVTSDKVEIFGQDGTLVQRDAQILEGSADEISKAGYEHFTLKEIHEQPQAVGQALMGRLDFDKGLPDLEGIGIDDETLRAVDRVLILGCGTSYHAGMVAAYMLEELARIPCEVEISSEFRYKNPIVQDHTLVLAISQSGETADTLAAVRECKAKGARVLCLCNVQGSSLSRLSDGTLLLRAGPEIGVASTKAYTNMLVVLNLLTLLMARLRDLRQDMGVRLLEELAALPTAIQQVLNQEDEIRKIAEDYAQYDNFFYIGRHYMYPNALEGALKLKEISYINANAYPAGELKHGPIALIDADCPTVAFCANRTTQDKMHSNIMEVRARHGKVIAIVNEGDEAITEIADAVIRIPLLNDPLAGIPASVAAQIFAYYVAYARGCEIDQPRNLAKSVTVE